MLETLAVAVGYSILSCATLAAVDGDTIKCDGVRMRLIGDGAPFVSGFDTPEIGRAKCPKELALGIVAKNRLSQLLGAKGIQIENTGSQDTTQSRRSLVRVRLPDGRTAGRVLLLEGMARKWSQDYHADWCGGDDDKLSDLLRSEPN